MKVVPYLFFIVFLFTGCTQKQIFEFSKGEFERSSWKQIQITKEQFEIFLQSFKKSCNKNPYMVDYCGIETLQELKQDFALYKFSTKGFMTGYYEPLLYGSRQKSDTYKYPLYEKPKDMYEIDLSEIYEDLKGYRLRGRIQGDKIVPYYSHEEIATNGVQAEVICYVNSQVDAFFLQIQGSGKVKLDTGETINVGYADQNGHRYYAIGRYMYEKGYLKEVSMQSIRAFLEQNPQKMDEILHQNQSYVFFREKKDGATGALGVQLTQGASVAVDRSYIPLGFGLLIKSDKEYINPLVVAQDVGGAIRGEGRIDYFFGSSQKAADLAGVTKEEIELFLLVPKK